MIRLIAIHIRNYAGEFSRGDKETVDYLTEDEIDRIMALEYKPDSLLAHARDMFIFQAFTGMSYSDLPKKGRLWQY